MTAERVEIGNCTLYRADCRDLSPNLLVGDTILTDPVWPNCPPGLLQGSDDPAGLLSACLDQITARRLVLVVRHDSDPRFFRAVPDRWPFFRVQILPYVIPGFIGRKLGGDELAYSFGEPIPSSPGRRVIPGYGPKVQPHGRRANGRPCSRSLDHFKWLVDWWSLPGETVIDPFMGSATTGVACALLGRRFVGVEIEPRYFEIACKRIEDAYRQSDLFLDGVA
jgi:site-specific DNA-methyltransferase (adenine-specific)